MEITVNTNLADTIIKVINDLCDKLGIAFDWTATNVWPKIQELMTKFINYKIGLDWFGIFFPFGVALLFLILGLIAKKEDWDFDLNSFFWIMFGISTGVFVILCVICSISLFRCYNFPEFEIYKYLQLKEII